MNKRGHIENAVLLSIGIPLILEGNLTVDTGVQIAEIGVPIILGALFPDIDTAFGTHRQTFHNIPTLLIFLAFPLYVSNLFYVWVGVLTHYLLDLLGNVQGMAVFYPLSDRFYDIPVGVPVDSKISDVVTLAVTGLELLLVFGLNRVATELSLQDPGLGLLALPL